MYFKPQEIIKERFKVVKLLKQNKYSTIYIVSDLLLQDKLWALKIFNVEFFSDEEELRVVRKLSSKINSFTNLMHPALPKVIDTFSINHHYCIVMEYIEGKSLEEILSKIHKPIAEDKVISWALQIASALVYLHSQQFPILFGELKPSHIIITNEDIVKLVDFGLTKIIKGDTKGEATEYSAPEESLGLGREIRSEVYSLAAVIYKMLTLCDISKFNFAFPPVTQFNPLVSLCLEKTLLQALKEKPEERYQNMNEFLVALKDCLDKSKNRSLGKPPPALLPKVKSSPEVEETPIKKESSFGKILSLVLFSCILFSLLMIVFLVIYLWRNKEFSNSYDGIALYEQGEYKQAAKVLTKELEVNPLDARRAILLENSYIAIFKDKSVTLATVVPLTGNFKDRGEEFLRGVSLAQYIINHQNILKGVKLKLEVGDDQGEPKQAVNVALGMVENKEILGIIGHMRSSETLAAAPIYNMGKLVNITPTSTSPLVSKAGDYTFRLCNSDIIQGQALAKYVREEMEIKEVVILYDDTNQYSQGLAENFEKNFSSLGGKLISKFKFISGSGNIEQLFLPIKELSPEAVFIAGYVQDVLDFCNAPDFSPSLFKIIGGDALYSKQLVEEGGENVEGVVFTSFYYPSSDTEPNKTFIESFKKNFGYLPGQREALAYDATMLLSTAAVEGGGTREGVRDYLINLGEKYPPFVGVGGIVVFDEYGDVTKDMVVLEVQGGKIKPIGIIKW